MMIIGKASIIIYSRNYVDQTLTSLQINKTLSLERCTLICKAVHTTPFLCDRFTSELFTMNDEMKNPLVYCIYRAQTILELFRKRKLIITSK